MRYFTRKRQSQSQDDVGYFEDAETRERRLFAAKREWETANAEYNAYISRVGTSLPPALEYVSKTILHDAVIASAAQSDGDVELFLKMGEAFWFPKGVSGLVLLLRGVSFESGLADAPGQSMLYDEIFIAREVYEFSALLEKTELVIRFREITMKTFPREGPERQMPLRVR
jgi:hypothetical protein